MVGLVASADLEQARDAIEAARQAFPAWRDTSPSSRARYLFQAAAAARKMRYELAALQVFEVGKTWNEADADVCEAIDFLEYYGREMLRLGKPRRMGHAPGEDSRLLYEPRGVGVVIAPWNFPLAISMGMTSAAIVAGNTVVYKPSSQSAVTGSMMVRLFQEAKLPPGVLNFLPGPGSELGEFLVTHPDVAFVAFTGSMEVGLRIIELAHGTPEGAMGVKNVIAEMGGKNAIIVDADADLDEAVRHILQSAFGYQGQKCSACSRLIVLKENAPKLLDRLKAAAESLNLGPSEDPKNFMGAVIDAGARHRIEEYAAIGREEGKLLVECHSPEASGHVVPLRIFTDIRPEHRLAQEEIFGPILAVIEVEDFDEALQVANSTCFALTGAVFSRSPANIAKARREFRVGNLYINRGCTGALGRTPPVRRIQDVGDWFQGGWTRLPIAVHGTKKCGGKHHASRVCSFRSGDDSLAFIRWENPRPDHRSKASSSLSFGMPYCYGFCTGCAEVSHGAIPCFPAHSTRKGIGKHLSRRNVQVACGVAAVQLIVDIRAMKVPQLHFLFPGFAIRPFWVPKGLAHLHDHSLLLETLFAVIEAECTGATQTSCFSLARRMRQCIHNGPRIRRRTSDKQSSTPIPGIRKTAHGVFGHPGSRISSCNRVGCNHSSPESNRCCPRPAGYFEPTQSGPRNYSGLVILSHYTSLLTVGS